MFHFIVQKEDGWLVLCSGEHYLSAATPLQSACKEKVRKNLSNSMSWIKVELLHVPMKLDSGLHGGAVIVSGCQWSPVWARWAFLTSFLVHR